MKLIKLQMMTCDAIDWILEHRGKRSLKVSKHVLRHLLFPMCWGFGCDDLVGMDTYQNSQISNTNKQSHSHNLDLRQVAFPRGSEAFMLLWLVNTQIQQVSEHLSRPVLTPSWLGLLPAPCLTRCFYEQGNSFDTFHIWDPPVSSLVQ